MTNAFADALKKRSTETGRVVVQGVTEGTKPLEKASDTNAFAAALKKRSDDTGRKAVQGVTNGNKPMEKAEDKNAFAQALQKRKAQVKADAAAPAIDPTFKPNGIIKAWSVSSLHDYEECPGRLLRKKHPEKSERWDQPENPNAARGTAFHDSAEAYVRGQSDELFVDRKMKIEFFMPLFAELRKGFEDGKVSLEEDWAFRTDWSPCGWFDDDVWGRGKLDFFIRESETSCVIGDYKTGNRWNNTVKHADQGLAYALQVYHRFPEIEHFRVEFWYIDDGTKSTRHFTRKMLTVLLKNLNKRAVKATSDETMQFKPSEKSCMFCSFGCNKSKQGRQYGNGYCEADYYRGLI